MAFALAEWGLSQNAEGLAFGWDADPSTIETVRLADTLLRAERERRDRQWHALGQLLALVPPGGDLDEVIHLRAADLRAAVLAAIDCGWFAPAPEPGAAGEEDPDGTD
jgi:hypothetical protein